MSEVPICGARANVMTYDDMTKKWVPSGSSQGLSKVQIYQHTVNNTFRVVGRKLQDHEVVINCAILKNLKYNQATPTFHQWRDSRHVYGLNFANKDDSETFSNAMMTALETLNNQGRAQTMAPPNPPSMGPGPGYQQPQPQQQYVPQQNVPQQNGPQDIDTRRHVRHPSGGAPVPYAVPVAPQIPQQQPEPVSQPTPAPMAPQAPPAPPVPVSAPPTAPPSHVPAPPAAPPAPPAGGPPPAPPAPPAPPSGGPPPPPGGPPPPPGAPGAPGAPPPPPPPAVSAGGGGGLAAALQAAKLRKTEKAESADSKPPSGGGSSGGGSSGGPVDHMAELQKKLLARQKVSQPKEEQPPRTVSPSPPQNRDSNPAKFEKPATNGGTKMNGMPSPKFPRRRTDSLKETSSDSASAINNTELETLKQEILTEMRKEMNKMKQEILDAIRDSAR